MLTLRQLRYLAVLADTLHFHRAAEQCHVTQPALSTQIRLLEDHLGVQLLERTRRRVVLTPIGKEIAERARQILTQARDIEDLAKTARRPLAGPLRMGVVPTLGPYLLPHVLPAFREQHPELKLYLREDPVPRLLRRLHDGDLDVLLIDRLAEGAEFEALPLFREPLWIALPRPHRLEASPSVGKADLADEDVLLLEEGHGLREQALALCHGAGAREHEGFQATSLDTLRQMVASRIGITLLPALYVVAEAARDEQIAVRPFRDPGPERLISLVWRLRSARRAEYLTLGHFIRNHLPEAVEPVDDQGTDSRRR